MTKKFLFLCFLLLCYSARCQEEPSEAERREGNAQEGGNGRHHYSFTYWAFKPQFIVKSHTVQNLVLTEALNTSDISWQPFT